MDFGYEEYFFGGDRCFIEWPEKVEELIPEEAVFVLFFRIAWTGVDGIGGRMIDD